MGHTCRLAECGDLCGGQLRISLGICAVVCAVLFCLELCVASLHRHERTGRLCGVVPGICSIVSSIDKAKECFRALESKAAMINN